MVGARPIKEDIHLGALSGPGRARTIIVLLVLFASPRHAMPRCYITFHTLCSRPTAIPNLRSRLVETEERRRSHVGHSHDVCDLRPRRCPSSPAYESSRPCRPDLARSSSSFIHRPLLPRRRAAFDRVTNVSPRNVSS